MDNKSDGGKDQEVSLFGFITEEIIKEATPMKYGIVAVEAIEKYRKKRIARNFESFLTELENAEPDESLRRDFQEKIDSRDDKDEVLEVVIDVLTDRDGELKTGILTRMLYALVSGELAVERFYDLAYVLNRLNARTLRFLAEMANSGFQISGGVEVYSEDAALLVAIGIANKQNDVIQVNSLGEDLYKFHSA